MKTKRKGRMFAILVILISLPILLYVTVNLYARLSTEDDLYYIEEASAITKKPDVILVLGAGVRPNGSPSNMLEDRLLTAYRLYESGICEKILVSGDHGTEYYDEVNVMKSYLVEKGVPSENVYMDHAGFSTYDSIYRAKAIFGVKRPLIVTQEYHSFRSMMIANHLDLDPIAVAAPILSSNVKVYPKQTWYSFRETMARVKDFFWCIVKPEPTFLGEPISLQASGDLTNDGKTL